MEVRAGQVLRGPGAVAHNDFICRRGQAVWAA